MLRASLISLLALGVVAQEPAKVPAPAPAPAPVVAPAPAPKPEEVVLARVGGEAITEADFQAAFRLLGQQEQMQILMIQGGKEEFVKRMAESKLLSVKAKRMELDKTPGYLRALDRTKDDLLAREYLAKEGEALQKKLVVAEADVKTYYDKHPERFKQPDLVSVRHILVSVKQGEDQPGLSDADAKKRIAKIQAELKKGAKFEDLARKYTDDPGSKESGGLYADADPSAWVPEFGAAARTQPVGKVGAPVKTQYGYHLVKVEARKPARQVPFEEAKQPAEKMAQQERQATVWNELMDSLRKEIPFEVVKSAAPKAPEAPKAVEAGKAGAQ
ncbi:MAG: peptidylprolyl isomerase [Geothrix sp.]|uniref:peptidylprolyl isomerase n=1 Tax=Geothrix sp. TaxID=1962974 RepID=UPI00179A9FCB|nr:peptidylprolyl isomerase [Geothrix sp.]NWJ40717.1 peptidylprolyl isomerase [Geothrix sp.]WIL21276.1 MAG: peptidylprolyl isomerase [Geothrix sp.]